NQPNLLNFQRKLAQPLEHVESWADAEAMISLTDVVKHAKPTVLIGVSGQPGLFTQEVVEVMAENSVRPIIFPLSNPTSQVAAVPADILQWTRGRALCATGRASGSANDQEERHHSSQPHHA